MAQVRPRLVGVPRVEDDPPHEARVAQEIRREARVLVSAARAAGRGREALDLHADPARPELLRFVTGARAKGCRVWMAVGSSKGAIRMPRDVYKALTGAGVSVRRVSGVHDKFFAVHGKFGGRYQHRVYTGSQNWSGGALGSNDEIFVKLAPESATVSSNSRSARSP